MKKMKRYWIAPLFWVFMAAFCWQFYSGKWIGILQDDEILLAFLIVTVLAVDSVSHWIRHWRCKKKKKEVPVLSRKDRIIRISVFAALLLAEVILILVRQGQSWEKPVAEADLAEVEGEGYSQVGSSQRFDNEVSFCTSFAVPKQYDFRMSGKNANGVPVTMQVCYYDVANAALAEPMFEAIMEAKMNWNQILMQWEIEAEVEEAYAAGYMGYQYLFLRDGDHLMTVYYYGEQDLTEKVDLFVSMLKR